MAMVSDEITKRCYSYAFWRSTYNICDGVYPLQPFTSHDVKIIASGFIPLLGLSMCCLLLFPVGILLQNCFYHELNCQLLKHLAWVIDFWTSTSTALSIFCPVLFLKHLLRAKETQWMKMQHKCNPLKPEKENVTQRKKHDVYDVLVPPLQNKSST